MFLLNVGHSFLTSNGSDHPVGRRGRAFLALPKPTDLSISSSRLEGTSKDLLTEDVVVNIQNKLSRRIPYIAELAANCPFF